MNRVVQNKIEILDRDQNIPRKYNSLELAQGWGKA